MVPKGFSGIFYLVKPSFSVLSLLMWLGTVSVVLADDQSNPFQSITDRNVFALKPPPPPPSNDPAPAPPPQLAKVVLTGLTSLFGPNDKRAFLEIEETGGKEKKSTKPILREGERNGVVEVIAIDLDKGVVKIRNNGFETNLVFAEQKSSPAPPTAAPGTMPMPGRLPGAFPGTPPMGGMGIPGGPSASGAMPMVIPRRGVGSDQVPPGYNPAGSTSTGFSPATGSTTPAPGYRSYPGARSVMPSSVPLPPGYQK
jgi:hypothetical protein